MPPPSTQYTTRSSANGYDPATLSDDEESDARSTSSISAITLGFSDGAIDSDSPDMFDWKISRIGGQPVFPPLSTAPSVVSASCTHCSTRMPLLTQIYCPLDQSDLERVLYVFSCPRKQCRAQPGTTRVWRASVTWAGAEMERQKEVERRKREQEKVKEREEQRSRSGGTPFDLGSLIFGGTASASSAPSSADTAASGASTASSTSATSTAPVNVKQTFNPFAFAPSSSSPFASSSNPFATSSSSSTASATFNPFATTPSPRTASAAEVTPTSPTLPSPSPPPTASADAPPLVWPSPSPSSSTFAVGYPPEYLTTAYEPESEQRLPSSAGPASKNKRAGGIDRALGGLSLQDDDDGLGLHDDDDYGGDWKRREGKGSGGRVKKGAPSSSSNKNDKRAGSAGSASGGEPGWQGETYEVQRVAGVDDVFLGFVERVGREPGQLLRYGHSTTPLPFSATSSAYKTLFPLPSTTAAALGTFTPSRLPPCSTCRGPTVFELQLMPNLVGLLNRSRSRSRARVSETDGPGADDDRDEDDGGQLDWATAWVTSCLGECTDVVPGSGGLKKEAWREERVWVEWEE